MNAHTQLIPRSSIEHLCKQRELALATMRESAEALAAAYEIGKQANRFASMAYVGIAPSGSPSDHDPYGALFPCAGFDIDRSMEAYRKHIDKRIWHHLLNEMGVRKMMDAEAIKQLDNSINAEVPEATVDNVRATLQTLHGDTDMIFRRGLVNCFAKLDRRFKSHDGFKIGSRIIVDRAFSDTSGTTNWGGTWDTIADVERVLAVLDDQNPEGSNALRAAVDNDRKGHWGPQQSQTETAYFRIDGFKNCNAHLWFTRDDLVEKANKILAEHYGEVLADAYDEGDPDSGLFNKSNVPAKDLQFYPTPPEVVEILLKDLHLDRRGGALLLEPSAGQGAIAIEAAKRGALVRAIEVNPEHCDVLRGSARRAGLRIDLQQDNFLRVPPVPHFEFIVMNPPFFGTHYMDHVRHAFKFLCEGGTLRAVLPASAEVNESRKHSAFRKWAMAHNDLGWAGPFRELPPESFARSGTRIQTTVLHLRRSK